ncbi:MAG: response regulator [Alphaproteobacteria bacterium]|nr:response regulator [Alphaproteobacteria bacterium]
MNARISLFVLALLTLLSAGTGGVLFYVHLSKGAMQEAVDDTERTARVLAKHTTLHLEQLSKSTATLSSLLQMREALQGMPDGLERANMVLDNYCGTLGAAVCYLLDRTGTTIASSNRKTTTSFVGKNYAFRPYFKEALAGKASTYMALGVVTRERGIYYGNSVTDAGGAVIGVVVIKAGVEAIENEFRDHAGFITLTDVHNVVFVSNRPDWLFRTLNPLNQAEATRLRESHQYGDTVLDSIGLKVLDVHRIEAPDGKTYLVGRHAIDALPDWQISYFLDSSRVAATLKGHEYWIAYGFGVLFLLTCLAVVALFRTGARDIARRQTAELALERRTELETLLASISSDFVSADAGSFHAKIVHTLMALGLFTGTDRVVLFLRSPGSHRLALEAEWSTNSIKSRLAAPPSYGDDELPWLVPQLKALQTVYTANVAELPPEAERERELLKSFGVISNLSVPLVLRGAFAGFIGFHAIRAERRWTENDIRLLVTAAEILSFALEREHTELALLEARDRAEATNQAKSQFLANMSHEIRTPMNAIIGLSHLALKATPDPGMTDYLTKIKSSATALLGIINDILDFSKIEAGKLSLENIEFSLQSVLDGIANVTSLRAAEKGIELLFTVSSNARPSLMGDPLRLGQILMNLVNNAVKFTETGEVVVSVEQLEAASDGVTVRFSVRDTGIGMTEEQMSHLFQSFSQADMTTTRRFGGTGLGLAISNRLAAMMNGSIAVKSQPGLGSTFTFEGRFGLPKSTHGPVPAIPEDLRDLRVLVVDDNATSRTILAEILTVWSMQVTTATGGLEAIALLEQASAAGHPFNLVLMDWQMPQMDGIEATRLIKEDPRIAQTLTVVMITAFGREEVMAQAEQLGIQALLIKPVGVSLLFDTIVNAFGGHASAMPRAAIEPSPTLAAHALGARVLVAEDNEINQQVAEELLTGFGIAVDIVANGRLAVEAMLSRTVNYDAVLMDVQMPEMDGLEATRRIRSGMVDKCPPVIAMTAHAIDEDKKRCLDAGMCDHIAKPIDPIRLITVLNQWIAPRTETLPHPFRPPSADTLDTLLPDVLPPFNIAVALPRVNGNRKLLRKLIIDFGKKYDAAVQDLRRMVGAGAIDEAGLLAHTLKGVAGNLEARALFDAAHELERGCRSGSVNGISGLIDGFEIHLTAALAAARSLMTERRSNAASIAVSPPSSSLNSDVVAALAAELIPLLDRNSLTARKRFPNFQSSLAGQGVDEDLQEMAVAIEGLDFTKARQCLDKISGKLVSGDRHEQ